MKQFALKLKSEDGLNYGVLIDADFISSIQEPIGAPNTGVIVTMKSGGEATG